MHRIIYYYQTFIGMSLKDDTPITHIHLSAIHFGNNQDGTPYIHLNNYPPNNKKFDSVWKDMEKAKVKVIDHHDRGDIKLGPWRIVLVGGQNFLAFRPVDKILTDHSPCRPRCVAELDQRKPLLAKRVVPIVISVVEPALGGPGGQFPVQSIG